MNKTVLGIFSNRTDAEKAIAKLEESGYTTKDISIMMKDAGEAKAVASDTGTDVAGGAVSGATTGGVIGGLAGLLARIGALTNPGVGPFLVAGPVAAALGLTGTAATTVTGAVTGAVAGGLIGALMNLGLSEEDAKVYETGLNDGGILVAVPARTGDSKDAEMILRDFNADQVRTVSQETDRVGTREEVSENAHHSHMHDMSDAHTGAHGTYAGGSEYVKPDVDLDED
jgi:hypothetical protein